jgi:hypothetical protein
MILMDVSQENFIYMRQITVPADDAQTGINHHRFVSTLDQQRIPLRIFTVLDTEQNGHWANITIKQFLTHTTVISL